ncbi:hypothetical protein ElyMa_002489000 [Elysia marginata]|uniref:Uncharacterized protein n=1 Tax=Elysia marginata TaxID=1093978 RepID=A0AAV4GQY1_9GAST|nr:hypothetical protein ElyMa_002489000 [Elysia marginata]
MCSSPIHRPHPDPASPTPTYAMGPGTCRLRSHPMAREGSYSVTNLDSALTMLMTVYVYVEEAVNDTKQIALRNTTGGVEHL